MSFWDLFEKRNKKHTAAVFVDFEHWYIALDKNFGIKPDIKEFTDSLAKKYIVSEMTFFGDFSNPSLASEMHKIRGFTNKIVETNNGGGFFKKDFTDFIMLDHIYRSAFIDKDIDTYVIFTGDGHFSSAVLFLKNSCKKNVVVYGVKNAFSGQLKQAASSYEEIPFEQNKYAKQMEMILTNLYALECEHKNSRATFSKTVSVVAQRNEIDEDSVSAALQKLIDDGYITQYETLINKRRIRLIKANFESAARDGLFKPVKKLNAIKKQRNVK